MDAELDRFVREALSRPLPAHDVQQALVGAGWSEAEAKAAVSAYRVTPSFPLPVPKKPVASAKSDAALHFIKSAAFFAGIWAFIDLLFTFVNLVVPEPGGWRGSEAYGIRHAVATLTVALPLYVLLHFRLASRTPRPLVFLTLGAAGIAAMASAVMLVDGMLAFQGNLNGGLKLIVLLAVAIVIFLDYVWVLRRDASKPITRKRRTFEISAAAVVTAIYVTGFVLAIARRAPAPNIEPPPKPVPAESAPPAAP